MNSRLHAHIGTFRQLEILLAVYQGGSIKAASESLYLTQPTVSMQLKKLTEAIGLPLYHQIGKKIKFTDAGLETVETAKHILESCRKLDMKLADLRGLKSGTLRISCVTTAKYFIPHLLGPFCQLYPGIDVQFTVANRQQIIERLEQGLDDFYVFSHLPNHLNMNVIELLSNNLVAIAGKDHPIAKRKAVSLADFCNESFLVREEGSGTRYAIDTLLAEHNIKPNVKMTIASNEAIIHSVLSNHTLAFGENYQVDVVNVKELPIKSQWSFVWDNKQSLSLIADVFLNFVETQGKQILAKTIS